MKNRNTGVLLIVLGLIVAVYGGAPALGLSGVSTGVACPSTIYFYSLTNGQVSPTPVGSASLMTVTQAVVAWQVGSSSFVGLPASYSGTAPASGTYVLGNSSRGWSFGEINSWGSGVGFVSSFAIGRYNSDGSCSYPGGVYLTSTSTTSSGISTTIIQTSIVSSTSSVSITTSSSTTTIHGTEFNSLSSYETTLVFVGIVLILAGVYVTRKKGTVVVG